MKAGLSSVESVSFHAADCSHAKFFACDFNGATFAGANLDGAEFREADGLGEPVEVWGKSSLSF